MARFAKAEWVGPSPNIDKGGMIPPLMGLILHVQQGHEAGSESWFKNPKAQVSAHFLIPLTGGLRQMVDTADKAWAEGAGNSKWISLEFEGFSGQAPAPTAEQIEGAAELLAWLHTTDEIPLASTDSVSKPGLGWHGMGGVAFGDHLDCPGDRIKDARPQIIARAKEIVGVTGSPLNADAATSARDLEAHLRLRIAAKTPVTGDASRKLLAHVAVLCHEALAIGIEKK